MLKLVQTTVADRQQADRLARELVDQALAACVQSLPITSTYRWQGEVEETNEILLLIKTTADRVSDVQDMLAREHPYEVPEIITFDPDTVSAPYAAWAEAQTKANE